MSFLDNYFLYHIGLDTSMDLKDMFKEITVQRIISYLTIVCNHARKSRSGSRFICFSEQGTQYPI